MEKTEALRVLSYYASTNLHSHKYKFHFRFILFLSCDVNLNPELYLNRDQHNLNAFSFINNRFVNRKLKLI